MGRGRAGRAAILLCLTALVQPASAIAASADADEDAKAVFCLAGAQRQPLRDAGKALDLAVPPDVTNWRRDRPAEFDRACSALYRAVKAPPPNPFADALPFLTALLGAVLAFAAATWRERVMRGRQVGDALRTAVIDFHDAARAYLDSWGANRPEAAVRTARGKLVTQLAVAHTDHPRWTKLRGLRDQLAAGPLGDRLTAGWAGPDDQRTAALVAALDALRDDVLLVARALGRPLRRQSALKAT
ncbi:hypothetical protein ACQPZF_30395 [Actinosynnema sp. CS-041913]|uniref:hypothetical protein n=1 Tax=Actinosynnema sp. CS-041913 TaxID=3239917 RepID=UPI003D8DA42F